MNFPIVTPTAAERTAAIDAYKRALMIDRDGAEAAAAVSASSLDGFLNSALLCNDYRRAAAFLDGLVNAHRVDDDGDHLGALKLYRDIYNRIESFDFAGWTRPELLATAEESAPDFPAAVFPPDVECYIQSVADALQVPRALPAAAALAVVSAAAQGRFLVEHPDDTKHRQPTNLYILIEARPGERKSPTITEFTRHIFGFIAEQKADNAAALAEFEAKDSAAEAEIKAARKLLAAPNLTDEQRNAATERLTAAERRRAGLVKPASPAFIADDTTPEALIMLMSRTAEQAAILTAEGTCLQVLGGIYTGGNAANAGIYLKAYGAEPYSCHRAKGQSVTLSAPTLTMCVFAQPAIVQPFMQDSTLTGQGLADRFLFASLPQRTTPIQADNAGRSVNTAAAAEYGTTIADLLRIERPAEIENAPVLRFAEDARRALLDYQQTIYNEAVNGGSLTGGLEEHAMKSPAQVERIAALLHIMKHPPTATAYKGGFVKTGIEADTTANAISIHKYFINERLRERDKAGHDLEQAARRVLGKILRETLYKARAFCSRSALKNSMNHWSGDLESVLNDLQNAGLIEIAAKPGRRQELIYISPYLATEEINGLLSTESK